MFTRVVPILDCDSDGDPSKWPTADKGYIRNDEHWMKETANKFWAKELDEAHLGGPASSATWRLSRLPDGYAGFEKPRTDSKHIDRYLYGHPRGQFRSLNEWYPHFKHLMDNGGPIGCTCKLCTTGSFRKRASTSGVASGSNGARSVSPARTTSSYFAQSQTAPTTRPQPPQIIQAARPSGISLLPQGRLPSLPPSRPRKQVDEDGTEDVFRTLLDQLKAAEENTEIDVKITEPTSPDWRAGNDLLEGLLREWKTLPRFVPRVGEVVLFARDLKPEEILAWDDDAHTWQKAKKDTGAVLGRPNWEAGVVTQMPLQPLDETDLVSPSEEKSNVVNSGFRIEPLAEINDNDKQYSKQHRYVPLHGTRPLVYIQDCLYGLPETEWHPSAKHALSVSNTFSVIGRHRFKGIQDELSGSEATVFCRGAYIGSELITVGDAVRLLPNPDEQKPDDVTDILVVTAIKLRLVNIDDAGNDDWDEGRPYTICLHISGRAFTIDHKRSFDAVGKVPIPTDSDPLPAGLAGYGQWYHMTDPKHTKARLEVPFTRVFSRVPETTALETWFRAHPTSTPSQNDIQQFRRPIDPLDSRRKLKRGISALHLARAHAYANDPRINRHAGKSWFWADTRVEALDVHEVNNRFVGAKDASRTREQMESWRKLLKALDGSKHGLAAYHAERVKREEESKKEKQELANAGGGYGMVAAAVTVADPTSASTSGTDGEALQGEEGDEDQDMADVDLDANDGDEIMDDDDDDDDDDEANEDKDRLASPNILGGAQPHINKDGVIELSDDSD